MWCDKEMEDFSSEDWKRFTEAIDAAVGRSKVVMDYITSNPSEFDMHFDEQLYSGMESFPF